MARKQTPAQADRLASIRAGYAVTGVLADDPTANRPVQVLTYEEFWDRGEGLWKAWRTIPSRQHDGTVTEIFKVRACGTVTQH